MIQRVLFICILTILWSKPEYCWAQLDSIQLKSKRGTVNTDTFVTLKELPVTSEEIVPVSSHSPKKATLYSAILPGLGQVYNKKYWKVPIIYAGAAALGYSLGFNQRLFNQHKNELIYRQNGQFDLLDPSLDRYTDANLNELQDFYRRNRDLSYIGMFLLYALNIVDAAVDAHFFDFNVSDDLTMRIKPDLFISGTAGIVPMMGLSFRF
jgi:hypothetical protein